jgi:S-sulfo-L-cysteine synthase (O-acetyl-L-serine-dependent)
VKDRTAVSMLRDAEKAVLLSHDKIILDSTSGNIGIAYAMIRAVSGYRVTIVLPENASVERKMIMTAFGTELVFSSPFEGADGAIRLAKKILSEDPEHYHQPDQYSNPFNWKAHYRTTGSEIIAQTRGSVTHFIASLRGYRWHCYGYGSSAQGSQPCYQSHFRHPEDEMHGIEGMKYLGEALLCLGSLT